MTIEPMLPEEPSPAGQPQTVTYPPDRPRRHVLAMFTSVQWIILIGMGIGLVGIVLMTILIIWNAGRIPDDAVSTSAALSSPLVLPTASATPTPPLPLYVPDAIPTPKYLYWPPEPQLLSTPNAPSDLLWWDAQFLYRQPILLDAVAVESPADTWARVLFDQQSNRLRDDGDDLRIVVWDGEHWWEIPRLARRRANQPGWEILFHVQEREIVQQGGYYLYVGNLFAGAPPETADAPATSRLLLMLGEQESVEWGPEVVWTVASTSTQTLASPDGRIVIECLPGTLQNDVRVRLRTVPFQESDRNRPLPDYELHADQAPGLPHPSNVPNWSPPLIVTINWAGLPVDVHSLESRVHFEYERQSGNWYTVPVEFDARRGVTRLVTKQP